MRWLSRRQRVPPRMLIVTTWLSKGYVLGRSKLMLSRWARADV